MKELIFSKSFTDELAFDDIEDNLLNRIKSNEQKTYLHTLVKRDILKKQLI